MFAAALRQQDAALLPAAASPLPPAAQQSTPSKREVTIENEDNLSQAERTLMKSTAAHATAKASRRQHNPQDATAGIGVQRVCWYTHNEKRYARLDVAWRRKAPQREAWQ
jgi:hypothetical protein